MSESATAVDLSDRASFDFWHEDMLRFGDVDRQDHVNNVAFSSFCENGRVRFLEAVVRPLIGPGDIYALVRIALDFRREVHYPGTVETGTRVLRVGRSSVTLGQGLFNEGHCVVLAEAVVVLMDAVTRKSKPFPPEAAAALQRIADRLPAPQA
jgi:acyl-CoA thioester hydrolase